MNSLILKTYTRVFIREKQSSMSMWHEMKQEKTPWLFVFQRYGKIWFILLENSINHKSYYLWRVAYRFYLIRTLSTVCLQERQKPVAHEGRVGGRPCGPRIERRICLLESCPLYWYNCTSNFEKNISHIK